MLLPLVLDCAGEDVPEGSTTALRCFLNSLRGWLQKKLSVRGFITFVIFLETPNHVTF